MVTALVFVLAFLLIVSIILTAKTQCNKDGTFSDPELNEGFYISPYYGYPGNHRYRRYGGYRRYCSNCGYLGERACSECINCGTCTNSDGYRNCVSGDQSGPLFRKDCVDWNYGPSPYYNRYRYGGRRRYRGRRRVVIV